MEPPQQFGFVLGKVCEISADEIQQQQSDNRIHPNVHFGQPVQDPKLVLYGPVGSHKQNEGEYKIDNNRREGKENVEAGVLPFFVFEPKQRIRALQKPKQRNPTHEDQAAVRRRNRCKITNDVVHTIFGLKIAIIGLP